MKGIVTWAISNARTVIAMIVLSLVAGSLAYVTLPKEGDPGIEIPILFISVPFPGISAEDSEKQIVKPLESKMSDLEGLKNITGIASEGYGSVALEFEFGWNKVDIMADVRDRTNEAKAKFPDGAEQYSINEVNFSDFPVLVISLSGRVPERTMLQLAKDMQDKIETLSEVLEVGLAGHRDEMLEVLIDPLKLESYNVTAGELVNVVRNNNKLIAAGEIETDTGSFPVKIPSSFKTAEDVYNLPVKVNGDRVITMGDIAEIRLTFEDRKGTARYNGDTTVALQVIKRKGMNIIETVEKARALVTTIRSTWPKELQTAVKVDLSMDESISVERMVGELQASVLTAIALVMIVILASLGARSALLVGFAIPTSFLLAFALMGVLDMTISNIVMFGLILAVGMLVDGAIVVVEYADKRISQGQGPMRAYGEASTRMFWPIISSTATTLCAFLPMLFWPGVPGQFMRNLPITLIFVLSASLVVALIYLPVMGGISGRISQKLDHISDYLRDKLSFWGLVIAVAISAILALFGLIMMQKDMGLFGAFVIVIGMLAISASVGAMKKPKPESNQNTVYSRSLFGRFIELLVSTFYMPLISIGACVIFVLFIGFSFSQNNNGVEFFVNIEPERANVYVRARGNLSLKEKDALVKQVESKIIGIDGIASTFAFAGSGGLSDKGRGGGPLDSIGQVQIELEPYGKRSHDPELNGFKIFERVNERITKIPGIIAEIAEKKAGPQSGKALQLRISSPNWGALMDTTAFVRDKFNNTAGLIEIEDSRPLPGIDWQINVDVENAGRFGADVSTVGAMVQLVTRGLFLDSMRVDSSDDEIDIRVRVPEDDRSLSTIDSLKVRTTQGLVPLSNFIERRPTPRIGQIDRFDQKRYIMVKANLEEGLNTSAELQKLDAWLEEQDFPANVNYEWSGDQEEQAKSQVFLAKAFMGALGLMFIILLMQFNSYYNSILVLVAVVFSITGVLIGMMVMGQTFSIIMTGTGVVALAGIVVNNNIVLIDTYQEYSHRMPRLEAIIRTAESRIRPVLLTTLTTMAGLTPMMLGLSLNFSDGGYTLNAPTSIMWKQLATAIVFGLGIATVLTLILTPSLLAIRIWVDKGLAYLFGMHNRDHNKEIPIDHIDD